MSADDDGPGRREVANRLFAAEFDDATLSYSESDEERAPNYVVTPGGARLNRLFTVGVLTEVETVNENTLRGRVVDPTGAFVGYAGQYQPDEMAFLERTGAPEFVALTGKARTFEPEDGDRVYTSVRPERFAAVDADTRDRWTVTAAEATLERIAVFETALADDRRGEALRTALTEAGAPPAIAAGIPKAIEAYDTSPAYLEALRTVAVGALEVVAGEREEAPGLNVAPDDPEPTDIGPLPEVDVDLPPADEGDAGAEPAVDSTPSGASAAADEAADATPTTDEAADATPTTDEAATESEAETASTDALGAPEGESTGADTLGGGEQTADDETPTRGDDGTAGSTNSGEIGDDGLGPGEFDPGSDLGGDGTDPAESGETAGSEEAATASGEAATGDDGLYELSEEERQDAMEHGVEFSTGTDVPEPGESDVDPPDPEEIAAGGAADETPGGGPDDGEVPDLGSTDDGSAAAPDESADDGAGAVDLEDAVVAAMQEIGDGDAADREAVIAAVVDEHGVDPGAVEDAIQSALMAGKCFEPGSDRLQAI